MSRTSRSNRAHLLPPNANAHERAVSLATSFGDDILPEDIKSLWNLEKADVRFLSFLAWGLHLDSWRDDLDERTKRQLIADSFAWHRLKGTVWSVKFILADLGLTTVIREWWEIGTAPHTFAIEAYYDGNPADIKSFLGPDTESFLVDALYQTKPERSHLLYIVVIPVLPEDLHDHGCRWDYCAYGHGLLPSVMLEVDAVENPFSASVATASILDAVRYVAYKLGATWDECKYGDLPPVFEQSVSGDITRYMYADRDTMAGYNTWHHSPNWSTETWKDPWRKTGCQYFVEVFSSASAIWGRTKYGDLAAMGARVWHSPEPYRFGYSKYAESGDYACYIPVKEYRIVELENICDAEIDIDSISASAATTIVSQINVVGEIDVACAARSTSGRKARQWNRRAGTSGRGVIRAYGATVWIARCRRYGTKRRGKRSGAGAADGSTRCLPSLRRH